MTEKMTAELAGVVNGVNLVFNALIRHLDGKAIISKEQMADAMEAGAHATDRRRPPERARIDLALLRNLADLLRDPKTETWTPTVIEGGRSPHKDD